MVAFYQLLMFLGFFITINKVLTLTTRWYELEASGDVTGTELQQATDAAQSVPFPKQNRFYFVFHGPTKAC